MLSLWTTTPHDCMRVLITSSGQVKKAAGTPATRPAIKSSIGPSVSFTFPFFRLLRD